MASFRELRPTKRLASAGRLRTSKLVSHTVAAAALAAVLVGVLLLGQLASQPGAGPDNATASAPRFLTKALGEPQAHAPQVRNPRPGVAVRVDGAEHSVRLGTRNYSLWTLGTGSAKWQQHERGAKRPTPFGLETVTVGPDRTEQFLTVDRRQGTRTWRWLVGKGVAPRVAPNGWVGLLAGRELQPVEIAPVQIFDGNGDDVTPAGLRWSTALRGGRWYLELRLRDDDLPLPYTIDPAFVYRTVTTNNNGALGGTTLQLTVPAAALSKDLLVAVVGVRGNPTITENAAWTMVTEQQNGTNARLGMYYRVAGGTDAGTTYTWTLSASAQAVGGIGVFGGLRSSSAADAAGTAATGNSTAPSATSIATVQQDSLVVAGYVINVGTSYTTGYTERFDAQSGAANTTAAMASKIQAATGASGAAGATTVLTGRWVAYQHSFRVDATAPTAGTVGDPGANIMGTVALSSSGADDNDSTVQSVKFQYCANPCGTWTDIGTDTTSPFGFSWDTTAVANGLYDLRAVVTDWAGNTANTPVVASRQVDNAAPTSAITFPGTGPYGLLTWADITGTAADTGGSGVLKTQVSIRQGAGNYWNGSAFSSGTEVWNDATGTATWTLTFPQTNFPADGSYTVRTRAVDNAGNNETTPQSVTFTIDRVVPDTTITAQPSNPTNNTGASFSFSSSEGSSTFECRLDSGSWGACTSPKTYAGLAQGSHTFDVRATDSAGNVDASPATYTWTVDTTAPTSSITFPAASSSYRNASWNDISGSASDTGGASVSSVQVSIRRVSDGLYWNGSAFADASENWRTATGTTSWSLTFPATNFPADGDYTIRVRATDSAGNVEGAPVSRTTTIDNVAPNTSITAQPSNPTNATGASFSFSSTESGSTFECRLDTGSWGACTDPKSYAGLTQGSYTFDVRATDAAGNQDGTPASFTWTVDTTAPTAVVSFPASGSSYRNSTWNDIAGTASDTGGASLSTVQVSIRRVSDGLYWNGSAFADGSENWRTAAGTASWSLTFPATNFPADGDYVVRVRSSDSASNVETPTAYTVTIDNAAPNTTIDAQPANPSNDTAPSFSFSSTEGGSSFQCRLDGGSWGACTSPKSYSGLTESSHTFEVRATDAAGNQDGTAATYTWMLDTTAPTSSLAFPAASTSYRNASWNDISGSASDTGGASVSSVQVSIRRVSDGMYWNGSAFADASENWRTASGTTSWSLTFPAGNFPADGDYTIRVRATDGAGNVQGTPVSRTTTIDNAAPNTSITAQPANPTNATGASFSFSSTEPSGATFECRLDGGAWSACTDPKTYAALAQGSHTFDVRATDAAGNQDGTPATFTWTVDTTAPSSAATFPAASGSYNAASWNDFAGTASDSGGAALDRVEVSIRRSSDSLYWNGTAFADASENWRLASGTASWSLTFAAANFTSDGAYVVRFRATDTAGNVESAGSRSFTIDAIAPNTSITAQPGDPTNSTGASFSFSSTESGSTFECRLDGGSWGACSDPKTYAGLAQGSHTFDVRATDAAGNTDASPASYTWVVDTTAPASGFSFPAAGGDYRNASWNNLGGISSDTGGASLDKVEVSIKRAANDLYWNGSAFADASENWRLASGTSAWSLSFPATNFPADGDYVVRVRATDTAGNVESSISSRTFTIDNVTPDTTITTQPGDPTNSTAPSFSFSSTEPSGATFECRLDGGAWSACSDPKSYTGLTQGSHTFQVRTTDEAGNQDGTPASYTWTVDTTAPTSTLSFPAGGSSYTAGAWSSISGTASDTGGSSLDKVEVSIKRVSDDKYWDGSAFADATENWRLASGTSSWSLAFPVSNFPSDGNYVVRVRAADTAANVETTISSNTFTLDNVFPNTTITAQPSDPTNATGASFSFSSSETGSTFECRLDGGAWSACTDPKSYAGLTQGSHTFEVRATDAAANTDASPASFTWTVDTTDPTAAITFPANGGSYNAAGWSDQLSGTGGDTGGAGLDRVEFSFRRVGTGLYWDGAAFASASEVWQTASGTGTWTSAFPDTNFAADDDYTVRVRSIDRANNTSAVASHSFTVDTVPPETAIDSGPTGNTASAAATIAFSASPASGASFECRIDGGSWSACTSPKSYAGLAQGSHTFDVRASDVSGNTDASPASRTWVVDTMLPNATLDMIAPFVKGTLTLAASASDAGTGVASVRFERSSAGAGTWTTLNTDTTSPYGFDFDTTSVANGQYDFQVTVTDNAGNTNTSNLESNIWVDNAAPNAVIDAVAANVTGTVTLTDSSTDAHSGIASRQFQYRLLPAGTFTNTGAAWDTSSLTDGSYELRVQVTDNAGNSADSTVRTTTVDNTNPTVSFTTPAEGGYVNGATADPLTLVADANDLGSGVASVQFFECTAGGAGCTSSTSLGTDSAAPYEAAWNVGADGVRYLKVVVTDKVGRTAQAVVSVTVDRTVPDTTLGTNPGTPSNVATPTFGFSANEAGSSFECRIDAGPWNACASPHTTVALADGNHTFDVRAVDAAGNADASPASWTWLVDTTDPAATMGDPGANLRGDVALTSSQTDPGATPSGIQSVQYQYAVADTDAWVNTGSTWQTAALTDGLYDLRVVVTDNAGNVTESVAVEDRRVDNTAPSSSLANPGANIRLTTTFDGSASDGGSGVALVEFEYSLDGSSWTTIAGSGVAADPYDYGFDTTSLADGQYFFRTKVTDVAGNSATGTPVGLIRIDNTAPTAVMNDPGTNLRGDVPLTSTADDPGGSGVASTVYHYTGPETGTTGANWTTTSVADGVYDLHVVVTDVAGNSTASNVVASRRVDNTKPSTAHNAPAGWQSSAVTVTLSPTDAGSGVSNTQYSLDGGSWTSGTSVNVSGDGVHTISFFSTDAAGNIESPQTASVSIDTTPPSAGAMDPGNYLRGSVVLSANPDGGGPGAGLASVEFQHKRSSTGTWTSLGVDTTSPYSVTWNTTAADDGEWDLRFIARDDAVPTPNSETIDMPSRFVDNTAPTGNVSSPLNGATVSGNQTLGVTATDASPLASVEYFVNGSSAGSASSTPFQVTWDTTAGGDGAKSIYAVITDMAGNTHTTGTVSVTSDNFAPTVSLAGLAASVSGTVSLQASASGDTTSVVYEARQLPSGGWSSVGTSVAGAPWTVDWTPAPDGQYEVRAKARDAGGNTGISATVTTRVDNTAPSGSLTAPGNGQRVGGASVTVSATASDSGSGVASVSFRYRQQGAGGFTEIATDSSSPYGTTWNVTSLPSVAHEVWIAVTDAAGNTFETTPTEVDVDSTAPSVTLDNPGAQLSGTVALTATTTGDADVVAFGYSAAGANSWTAIGADGTAPYAMNFNTTTVADGLYDLRAVVSDAVGNTSTSVVAGVRIDNFIPVLSSSAPANGSITASANAITLSFSERIASLTGLTLDGNPAAAPTWDASNEVATMNTGSLADGSHTVTGTIRDAAGNSSSFAISFVIGVPVAGGGDDGSGGEDEQIFELPLVPMPSDFRGVLETDGTLTLRWKPAEADGKPLATILLVDGIATMSFAPGAGEVNLGPFDPADMRTFSVAAIGSDGTASPDTAKVRSTSILAGKSLAVVEATLVNRGFRLGSISGTGSVVVEPTRPLMVPLEHTVDVELGEPIAPQTRLLFNVVGAPTYQPAKAKRIGIRVRVTRPSQVAATLLSPSGQRVYRWRFGIAAGARVVNLTMPPQITRPGRYRLVFTVRSNHEVVRRTIIIRVLAKGTSDQSNPQQQRTEIVLAGNSNIRREIALGLEDLGIRMLAANDTDETFDFAGNRRRNVQVVVVDADRYGVQLVRDLRSVFPRMRIVALATDPRRLAQAMRVGATIAVPRSTPPRDLARLIARLARRP